MFQMHDRMAPIKLSYLASKNQDLSNEDREVTHKKGSTWKMSKNWGKLASMEEVVDAIENWGAIVMMTRWMSHEAAAFRRVMVDLRWMAGVSASEKEQVDWCEEAANKILTANANRASQGKGPLTYEDVRKKVLGLLTQKGKAESSLFTASGIYSSRSRREQELEKKVSKLQEDLKVAREKSSNRGPPPARDNTRGRGRGGGHGGGAVRGAHASTREPHSIDQKLAWTCKDYNEGGCTEPCPHKLRHSCSHTEGESGLCTIEACWFMTQIEQSLWQNIQSP